MPGRRVSQTPSVTGRPRRSRERGRFRSVSHGLGTLCHRRCCCETRNGNNEPRAQAVGPRSSNRLCGRTPREGSERRSRGPRTSKRHSSGGSTGRVLVAACTIASRRAAASSAEERDRLPHRPWHGPPASVQPVPGPPQRGDAEEQEGWAHLAGSGNRENGGSQVMVGPGP